jgi:hypothetical protein
LVIRKASPATDQPARSLLQKAIRRADARVARAAFRYLQRDKQDLHWLRARLAVIVFEEAWPYGATVMFDKGSEATLGEYLTLCHHPKFKDAAGLGSLAYAFSEGDSTVLNEDEGDWYIRAIAKASQAKDQFWSWISSESSSADERVRALVQRAREGSRKAGWPWDKAFACAAALLALKQGVPVLESQVYPPDVFPYWVAIDKHTPRGKEVLRDLARERKLKVNTVLWLSFYLESGLAIGLVPSTWWEREKMWRFAKLGMSSQEASQMWAALREDVKERLEPDAHALSKRIMNYMEFAEPLAAAGAVVDKQASLFG